MKNFLLGGIGKPTDNKKKKVRKMTPTSFEFNRIKNHSEEYIKKTTDFHNLDKVKEILKDLAKQKSNAKGTNKTMIQRFIDLFQEQHKALSNKMEEDKKSEVNLKLLDRCSDEYMKKSPDFNDLSKVECTLVQLKEEY